MTDSLRGSALFEGEGPIRIVAWPAPAADVSGFPAHSAMVEWCWLPLTGPSTAWAYRRLVSGLANLADGYDLDLGELAHWLGLGRGTSRNAPVARALLRLVRFDLAAVVAPRTLAVRRTAPPLHDHQLDRLSPRLITAHANFVAQLRSGGAGTRP